MLTKLFISFLLGTVVQAQGRPSVSCPNLMIQKSVILFQSPFEHHKVIDVVTSDLSAAPVRSDSQTLLDFKKWVQTFSSLKATDILEKQAQDMRQWPLVGDSKNWVPNALARIDSIRTGRIGHLTPIDCLTRTLFEENESRYPQRIFPGEMLAYILRSKTNPSYYRIYFSYGDGRKFDSSPPLNEGVWNQLTTDLSTSWTLHIHLHSHPFMVNYQKAPNVGGLLMPSDEDLQSYTYFAQSFQINEMWITNGIETVRFTLKDLGLLLKTVPSHPAYKAPLFSEVNSVLEKSL